VGGSNSLTSGTNFGEMLYWNGVAWVAINIGLENYQLTFCSGKPIWTKNGQCVQVGDTLDGGVVAYIFYPSDPGYIAGEVHGLIAFPTDLGPLEWGCESISNTRFYLRDNWLWFVQFNKYLQTIVMNLFMPQNLV
jgi:hypothetical protein